MFNKRVKSKNKFNNPVLLKNFDKYKLKITVDDCVDQNLYHINYCFEQDNIFNIACPLRLIIPEFYGHAEKVNGCKYLVIERIGNNFDVLGDYKKVWSKILDKINQIAKTEYVF